MYVDLSHSIVPRIEVKEEKKPINGEGVQKYCFGGDITCIICFLCLKDIFWNVHNLSVEFIAKICSY